MKNQSVDSPRCPHCNEPMPRYRCVMELGENGWPLSVKVCHDRHGNWIGRQVAPEQAK